MSLRRYGIYLAYPPAVDLRAQGLGRHLAMFLKGAQTLGDIRFTIVCPSWTRETLEVLFESEQLPGGTCAILAPEGQPYLLRLFTAIRRHRARPRKPGWIARIGKSTLGLGRRLWDRLSGRLVAVHDPFSLARFLIEFLCALLVLVPLAGLALPFALLFLGVRSLGLRASRPGGGLRGRWQALRARAARVLAAPQGQNWVLGLHDRMQQQEMRRMQAIIDTLTEVRAWYCPTAFWPAFHDIRAPRLMCVPDVVLADFPAAFCSIGGDRFFASFEAVELAIRRGEHFVTYSAAVKWNTLVDRYAVAAARVTVIPHAPNILNRHVDISGFPDVEATSLHHCRRLLRGALQRSTHPAYTASFQNGDVKFLFYASQLRPNKNVPMLLRAFEYLLRKRHLGHKLFLTGDPANLPEIGRFVSEHRLEQDVIFLPGLSLAELAACYKLADLAVNPTLSEGGCPFTFTEALSVGTPVVMSRIAVAEEVLTDPQLQAATLFDPFDWRDCARKIEWALTHREALLEIQLAAYAVLARRSWADVAAEHVKVLDELAGGVAAA